MARRREPVEPVPGTLREVLAADLRERHRLWGHLTPLRDDRPLEEWDGRSAWLDLAERLEAGEAVDVYGSEIPYRFRGESCPRRSQRASECVRRCGAIHPLDLVVIEADGSLRRIPPDVEEAIRRAVAAGDWDARARLIAEGVIEG